MTDLHSHLIPGVDDGARDTDESRAALAAFRDDGVRRVITTPHCDASLAETRGLEHRLAEIDAGWQRLAELAESEFPDMEVGRGVELRLDTPAPDATDPRIRLNGGPFALVEFPFMAVPPNAAAVLARLRSDDVIPLLAHPERYSGLDLDGRAARSWKDAGAYLQVNSGAILGRYGREARAKAMALLENGLVDCLSSDYHARGEPAVEAASEAVRELAGDEVATLLTVTNPGRIADGRMPVPVPGFRPSRGIGGWLRGLFR